MSHDDIRPGEIAIVPPPPTDAGLVFIGRIHTPFAHRGQTPHRGDREGPVCRIEIFEPWVAGLEGIETREHLQVLYWLHQARRDLVRLVPRHDGIGRGVFVTRAPVRPNPIGSSVVKLVGREGAMLLVRGLDCLDGTPLIDLKPEHCPVLE